jgi:hypothetical protein
LCQARCLPTAARCLRAPAAHACTAPPVAELYTFFDVLDEGRGKPVSKPKLAITMGKSADFDRIIAEQAKEEAKQQAQAQLELLAQAPQPEAAAVAVAAA